MCVCVCVCVLFVGSGERHHDHHVADSWQSIGKGVPSLGERRLFYKLNTMEKMSRRSQRRNSTGREHTRPQARIWPNMVCKDVPPKVYEPVEPAIQDIHALLPPLRIRKSNTHPNCPNSTNRITKPNLRLRVKQYGKIRRKTRTSADPHHASTTLNSQSNLKKNPIQPPQFPPKDPKPPPWRPTNARKKNGLPIPWENPLNIPPNPPTLNRINLLIQAFSTIKNLPNQLNSTKRLST